MNKTVSIEVDAVTASALQLQADAQGLSLAAYLKSLAAGGGESGSNGSLSAIDFERQLDELAGDSDGLPILPV